MFTLPELGYGYNEVEPYIDAITMEIHHSKHHQAYVNNLNAALENYPEFASMSLDELVLKLSELPDAIKVAVRNNGGGHFNHTLFWKVIAPNDTPKEDSKVYNAIVTEFGSFEKFKETFTKAAMTRFGSGWAWLVVNNETKTLEVISTANQDTPLELGKTPLIAIDVWEHAYYLKYQNKRPDYIEAFFNVINWEFADSLYK